MSRPDEPPKLRISSATVEGNDAVCFTAGPDAAVIGAGTIHAYLAARRKCPRVAAGISLGTLNAAAMQRAYRELQAGEGKGPEVQEAARWAWFRHYVQTLSDQPWRILWDALPNQSDFFADMIPIHDGSLPEPLQDDEAGARRQQYLLVKLGRWLAKLPVSVRLVVGILVNYVRLVERYPLAARASSLLALIGHVLSLHLRLSLYVCLSPQFFPEHKFREWPSLARNKRGPHRCRIPLLAWINRISTMVLTALALITLILLYVLGPPWTSKIVAWATVGLVVVFVIIGVTARVRRRVAAWSIVRRIGQSWLPVAVAYAFSLSNLLLFSVATVTWVLYLHAFRGRTEDWLMYAVVATALDLMLNLLAVSFVLVPETRGWLFDRWFLLELPRPLFGWAVYAFLWIHLAATATYLGLSGYLVAHVKAAHQLGRPELTVLTAIGLACFPAVPLIPVILPILAWRSLQEFARARAGWRKVVAWIVTGLISATVIALGFGLCLYLLALLKGLLGVGSSTLWQLFVLTAVLATATWLIMATVLSQPVSRRLAITWVMGQVGLQMSLIHDLYLRRKLMHLFETYRAGQTGQSFEPEELGDDPMPIVLVAASLQTLYKGGEPKLAYQLWAKRGTPLLSALRAAMAWAPIFAPVRITGAQLDWWLEPGMRNDAENVKTLKLGIDLVDGSVVRQNPLPALFSFLRTFDQASQMADNNDADHAAIHVVYGVPVEGQLLPTESDPTRRRPGEPVFRNTVVDVGRASVRLSRRRDTQLEVLQTNVISRIEATIPAKDTAPERMTHAIFADEIAPSRDLIVRDRLNPSPDEVLGGIAIGCRRSLETLYRHELAANGLPRDNGSVSCPEFLSSMGRWAGGGAVPGLPEVCQRCTRRLHVPTLSPREGTTVSVERDLGDATRLPKDHPQLTGTDPRIVFVASGGVFRGAFHIGMLGALESAKIKPDLIVGASVGTLMGGALGAIFAYRRDVLARLVDTFLRVDETVALTTTLKRAARELGIRGRAIRLSPRRVRRLLRRGARSDASFATTGAPAALIDALADLLLIPHRQTGRVAANFIAGRVTDSLSLLLEQLRTETIPRLDVERAVLGTSLLDDVALRVLTDGTSESRLQRQPYQCGGIAFYAMTTDLCTQRSVVLGGQGLHPNAPYDFVEAALASSAFPAVFSARPEASVFPGSGRADVFLADGGMFDNLPFVPAIEILSHSQRGHQSTTPDGPTTLKCLRRRLEHPDLIIAGALNFVAERDEDARGSFDSLAAIRSRASSLHHNSKIRAFELASQRIYGQLQRIAESPDPPAGSPQARLIDGIVNAAVLPVFPASADHLNGTFAFCRSTGLNRTRVSRSIADGCYQTFLALVNTRERAKSADVDHAPDLLAAKAVSALTAEGRVCRVEWEIDLFVPDKKCPYFKRNGERFMCPFAEGGDSERGRLMRSVFGVCTRDQVHHRPTLATPRQGSGSPARAAQPGADAPGTDLEGDMWSWRQHRGMERLRCEVVAGIESNRSAFADMVMRSAMSAAPAPVAAPAGAAAAGAAAPSPAPQGNAGAGAPGADVSKILARFAELGDKAKKASNRDDLEQLLEEAEALAALRAYICPGKEIATEAKSCLLTLTDWGVPTQVVDALKEAAGPALSDGKDPELAAQARGSLHVVYEEYDAWASYLDTYNRNTGWWAAALMSGIAVTTALTLLFMLGWSFGLLAVFLAAGTGAMASVIARLPGLTRYGEWMVNLRAFQARVATGIVGSLVGIGLLGSGLISVTLPEPWQKTEQLFGVCLKSQPRGPIVPSSSPPRASQKPVEAKPAQTPPPAADANPPEPSRPAGAPPGPPKGDGTAAAPTECTPGAGLFLIAITMLLGFSERILTSLESRVATVAGGPDSQKTK